MTEYRGMPVLTGSCKTCGIKMYFVGPTEEEIRKQWPDLTVYNCNRDPGWLPPLGSLAADGNGLTAVTKVDYEKMEWTLGTGEVLSAEECRLRVVAGEKIVDD